MNYRERARELAGWMISLRRDIHLHPELSFHEERTGQIAASLLEEWGFQVRRAAGTGIAAFLPGRGEKTVAVRADMDALPIQEETGLDFASSRPGVMHACGHDLHVACALGAARMLSEKNREEGLGGGVLLLLQPAEEINRGAGAMIRDGVLDDRPVDMIFGLHNHPFYPAGTVVLREGAFMAAVDTLKITIRGTGSHGAMPHRSADPILAAASVIMNLQSVVSRNVDPQEAAVVSFGTLSGGTADNVIPGEVVMTGTMRSFSREVRELVHGRVQSVSEHAAAGLGCCAEVEIRRDLPVVLNDSAAYRHCLRAAREIVGEEGVLSGTPSMGGEDFSLFQERIPGCLFWLGVGNPSLGAVHPWHSPRFTADESAIHIGAAILAMAAQLALPN